MAKDSPVSLTHFFNPSYTPLKSNVTLLQMSSIYAYLQPELSEIKSAKKDLHSHYFSEIFFITSGNGEFLINGKTYPVVQGDFVLINPSVSHVEINKYNLTYICLCLFPIRFKTPLENYVLPAQAQEQEFRTILENMLYEFSIYKKDSEDLIWLYFQEFLLKLKRLSVDILDEKQAKESSDSLNTKKHYSPSIELAMEYIDEHYTHDITLDDLTEITFLSKSHLIRLFKKETKYPPLHYINRVRVSRALYFLMRRDDSIATIAKHIGFKSTYAFISFFKKLTGYTPEQFRNELINNFSAVEHIVIDIK